MTRAEELGWVYQIDLMYFERYVLVKAKVNYYVLNTVD